MTNPTKIVVNLETGDVQEVELSGEELDAYNASLAAQALQNEQQISDQQK